MTDAAWQFCDWSGWASRVAADEYRAAVANARTAVLRIVASARAELSAQIAKVNRRQDDLRCYLAQQVTQSSRDERPSATARDISDAVTPTRGAPRVPALSLGPPLRA